MQETCPKCGRLRTPNDLSIIECPKCGIIYAKYGTSTKAQKITPLNLEEDSLQDEIRRRVFDREKQLRKQQEKENHTQATIEALKEISDIPEEEVKKIATRVQIEHSMEQEYQNAKIYAKWTFLRWGIAVIGFILVVKIGFWAYDTWRFSKVSYLAVFTSGTDETAQPVDSLQEIPITMEMFMLHVTWRSFPGGSHHTVLRIFDGDAKEVSKSDLVSNNSGELYMVFPYRPNINLDEPGKWRFDLRIDNRKMLEEYITVLPPDGVTAMNKIQVLSCSPSTEKPLQIGKFVTFKVKTTYDLRSDSSGKLWLTVEQAKADKKPILFSQDHAVLKGKETRTLETRIQIPATKYLDVYAILKTPSSQSQRIFDSCSYQVRE